MKVSYSWDKVKGADPMVLLTDETRKHIDHWVAKFPPDRKRSAMLQALMAAQEQNNGYLTDQLTAAVAKYLGVMTVFAFEVASFYSLLNTKPVGRHEVSVCTNISCWLNGADAIARHCEEKLGVKQGESTPDGRVFLKQEEECLAACCHAPVMQVDGYYHEHLTPEKVDEILDGLK
jgi:NADH-quinone oxidoreductase subunit E